MDIIPPNAQQPISNTGIMEQVFRTWTQSITRLINSMREEIDGGGA